MPFLPILNSYGQIPNQAIYLNSIIDELQKKWPENRTVNIVFHGQVLLLKVIMQIYSIKKDFLFHHSEQMIGKALLKITNNNLMFYFLN